ncbi:MAG: Crp/Fnr family transcriptional regulator, partial [Pollutimonas bauzanensis]
MPSKPPAPAANRLLAALPRKDRERFMVACERVDLQYAGVLAEAGEISHHAYFPTGALISLIAPIDGHAALQVGLVGDEGMLGMPLFLGVGASPLRAVVQGSGKALRIGAAAFRREIGSSPALVRLLERYLYVMAAQFA